MPFNRYKVKRIKWGMVYLTFAIIFFLWLWPNISPFFDSPEPSKTVRKVAPQTETGPADPWPGYRDMPTFAERINKATEKYPLATLAILLCIPGLTIVGVMRVLVNARKHNNSKQLIGED